MPTSQFDAVSVEEYLEATYDPDCEYIDGRLIQRTPAGEKYKYVKKRLLAYFREYEDACNALPLEDQRICILDTTRAQQYRIADVCLVTRPHAKVRILRRPPLVAIEILRPYEGTGALLARLSDFLRIGIPHIWAVDVDEASWFTVSNRGLHRVAGQQLAIPELSLTLSLRPFFKELE